MVQFLRAEGRELSHSAFRLHGFGILNSILLGRRGFISDDYLNAIDAETSVSALELVTAGLWERRPGGYAAVSGALVTELLQSGGMLPGPVTPPESSSPPSTSGFAAVPEGESAARKLRAIPEAHSPRAPRQALPR